MNEIGSLYLATLVLAIGGMGLYYYKSFDLNENENEDRLEENNFNEDKDFFEEEYEEPEIIEQKSRQSKSKKSRRKALGTKRRYY